MVHKSQENAMATLRIVPDQVVDLIGGGPASAEDKAVTLLQLDNLECVRSCISESCGVSFTQSSGGVVVICVFGRVALAIHGSDKKLAAGQMIYLPEGDFYEVRGLESRSVLLTIHRYRPDMTPAQQL